MTPVARRFTICMSLALAAHAGLLAAVTQVQLMPDTAPEHFLTVTLNTGTSAQKGHSRTLAQHAQQGDATQSRPARALQRRRAGRSANAARRMPRRHSAERVQRMTPHATQPLRSRQHAPRVAAVSGRNPPQRERARSARADPRAAYLTLWRRQVEYYGNRHYPAQQLISSAPRHRLTLGITLRADGSVHSVRVLQSSGSPALDHAARAMVRNAGPYAAFPESLRPHEQQLTFAYEWVFASTTQS